MDDTKNMNDSGIVRQQKINSLVKEVFRKSIHLCSAIIPFLLKKAYWQIIILLFIALTGYSICEFLRLKGHEIPLISKITETAARKRDENKFVLGPVTLVIGILLAALIYPLESASVAIYALAFGDGLASLVGKLCGRIKIPFSGGKTLEGSLACFFAVLISSFLVCRNFLEALIIASAGMLIELLPLKDYDNILIPILIGLIHCLLENFLF